MLYQKNYFSALTNNLSKRSERAAQGLLSLGNPQLRQFLHERLTAAPGTSGAWLADPVFEPTFGWKESAETMSSLAGGSLLHQQLALFYRTTSGNGDPLHPGLVDMAKLNLQHATRVAARCHPEPQKCQDRGSHD